MYVHIKEVFTALEFFLNWAVKTPYHLAPHPPSARGYKTRPQGTSSQRLSY